MRLFHGTSRRLLSSIEKHGIRVSHDEENGLCVSLMDSLPKAKKVAGYFGEDGVILEVELPEESLEFHPDYGHGAAFDVIRFRQDPSAADYQSSQSPKPQGYYKKSCGATASKI